jgi:hypothetical protein
VNDVSAREVDDVVRLGIDRRADFRLICKILDEETRPFLAGQSMPSARPSGSTPRSTRSIREASRVVSIATVVARGLTEDGDRPVLEAATGHARATSSGRPSCASLSIAGCAASGW